MADITFGEDICCNHSSSPLSEGEPLMTYESNNLASNLKARLYEKNG